MDKIRGLKAEKPVSTPTANFSQSENKGLQMGQNYGTMEASFYSDSIQGINIAAGASVYMGERKSVEDKLLDALIAGDGRDRCDIARAEQGTCEWIFEDAAFRDWATTKDNSFQTPLYIQGTPGSGKSVLMKYLAKELERRTRSSSKPESSPIQEQTITSLELGVPGKTIAAACFCDDRNEKRRQPVWIMRTLLYKIFQQNRSLVKYALKHLQNIDELDNPECDPDEFHSLDVLEKILDEILLDAEMEVLYIIVDGLDQCGPHLPAVVRLISDLSKRQASSRESNSFSLRCIVSDRGSKVVRERLVPQYSIDMPQANERDIAEVTDKKMKRIQEYRGFSDNVLKFTSGLLRESSRGMFMWISLVLDELTTWDGAWTELKVKERLHSIPSDVATYYQTMLEQQQQRDTATQLRTLLMWVYFACRPLTLYELHAILAVQTDKGYTGVEGPKEEIDALQQMIEAKWSALLLVHEGTVHLAHQSAKDFLSEVFSDDESNRYPGYGMSTESAHRQMASVCLTYLQIDEVYKREVPKPPVGEDGMIDETQLMTVRKEYVKTYSFLSYAVEFLGHHLRKSQIQEETDVKGMKEFFASDSAPLLSWVRSYDLLKRWTSGKYSGFSSSTSLLFVAARLDLPWLADRATSWRSYGSLPVDVRAPDMSGWSAIHIAADSEAVEMVDWLLKNNAYVDAETVGYSHPGRTALHFAASKRSGAGTQMVKSLLSGGAKATARTRQGGNTPLHYAVDGRCVATVQALIDSGADVNAVNGSGLTPLHKAASVPGLEEVVKALLGGGADPNKKTSIGTVTAARAMTSLKASRTLWQKSNEGITSQSALHIAVKVKDAERTVEALLEQDKTDPNIRDGAGRTPLHLAVMTANTYNITKLLIHFKADINAQDQDGRTPLLTFVTAAGIQAGDQPLPPTELDDQASKERVLDLLLSAGGNPFTKAKDQRSPMDSASEAQLQWAIERLQRAVPPDDILKNVESKKQPEPGSSETEGKRGLGQMSRWALKRAIS